MAKSGIKSGLRSARKHHIINNNNNETIIASATILPEAQLKIKQEPSSNEEFKEFAETAMNELLGWYGYGSSAARDNSAGGIEMARLGSYKSNSNSNSSSPVSPLHATGCGWCGKSVDENNGLLSGQSSFCSELCFSQSRRANFKKNKTCDWCRHVRHTVSYVDFQEGSAQLQFCSDKCLNQYKMHIFCRETQAHLEFHPHLIGAAAGGAGAASGSGGAALITPDLWLRDCKTPPDEDAMDEIDESMMREECTGSPLLIRDKRMINKRAESPAKNLTLDKVVPKLIPIITLAPTSSLLASPSSTSSKRIPIIKKTRNKRKRFSSATITSQCALNTSCLSMSNTNLDEEVPQDLRVRHNVTPPARMLPHLQELSEKSTNLHSDTKPILLNNLRSSLSNNPERIPFQTAPPNDLRVPNQYQTNADEAKQEQNKPISNISMIPPVTVLVPYPIMIPVPIPIPIPLPVSSFLTAYFGSKATDATNKSAHQEFGVSKTTADTTEKSVSDKLLIDEDERPEVASSTSGVDEEIVVDVVKDEPKSPRMLRRRKRMLGMNSSVMENKGGSSSKVIKRKI